MQVTSVLSREEYFILNFKVIGKGRPIIYIMIRVREAYNIILVHLLLIHPVLVP